MKKILVFLIFFLPSFVLSAGYQPLVSDSPLKNAASNTNLQEFLKQVYDWGVGIAVALAILFIIFGGIEYMTTDSVFKKEEGRKRVVAAVAGLLIVLSSWLILNQINPQIFNNNLNLGTLNGKLDTSPVTVGGTVIDGGGIPTNTQDTNTPKGESSPVIGDEAAIRSTLSQNGISVNKNPCTYVGQRGCTDTYGLKKSTLDTLLAMKNNSGASSLVLTGGTEGGGIHSEGSTYTHVNGYKVDIRPGNEKFDSYMRSLGRSTTVNGNQVNILNEGDHWDIQIIPSATK